MSSESFESFITLLKLKCSFLWFHCKNWEKIKSEKSGNCWHLFSVDKFLLKDCQYALLYDFSNSESWLLFKNHLSKRGICLLLRFCMNYMILKKQLFSITHDMSFCFFFLFRQYIFFLNSDKCKIPEEYLQLLRQSYISKPQKCLKFPKI